MAAFERSCLHERDRLRALLCARKVPPSCAVMTHSARKNFARKNATSHQNVPGALETCLPVCSEARRFAHSKVPRVNLFRAFCDAGVVPECDQYGHPNGAQIAHKKYTKSGRQMYPKRAPNRVAKCTKNGHQFAHQIATRNAPRNVTFFCAKRGTLGRKAKHQ